MNSHPRCNRHPCRDQQCPVHGFFDEVFPQASPFHSDPITIPFQEVLKNHHDFFPHSHSSYEGVPAPDMGMQHALSQHSWESDLTSSPHSYRDPLQYRPQFSYSGLAVSPDLGPSGSQPLSPPLGELYDESMFAPQDLFESDSNFVDPRSLSGGNYYDAMPSYNNDIPAAGVATGSYGSYPNQSPPHEASSSFDSSQQGTREESREIGEGHLCDYPGCTSTGTFKRKTDLKRHINSVHIPKYFDCEFRWCGRVGDDGFVRRDHYREHLREFHRKEIPPNKKNRQNSLQS